MTKSRLDKARFKNAWHTYQLLVRSRNKHSSFYRRQRDAFANDDPSLSRDELVAHTLFLSGTSYNKRTFEQLFDMYGDTSIDVSKSSARKTVARGIRAAVGGAFDLAYTPDRDSNNAPIEAPPTPEEVAASQSSRNRFRNASPENMPVLNDIAHLFDSKSAMSDDQLNQVVKIRKSFAAMNNQSASSGVRQKSQLNFMDKIQLGLDATGLFEPTPFSDSLNAGISLLRAVSDRKRAGSHIVNAGISLMSTVPYLGDWAKIYKVYGTRAEGLGLRGTLGMLKNNRSRLGRLASIAYSAMGTPQQNSGNSAGSTQGLFGGIGNASANAANALSSIGSAAASAGNAGAGAIPSSNASGGAAKSGLLSSLLASSSMQRFAGVVARVVGPLGLVVAGLTAMSGWLKKVGSQGESMLESQRNYARWSPVAANAMLKYDLHRLKMEGEIGRDRGESIAALSRGTSEFEEGAAKAFGPAAKLLNYAVGAGSSLAGRAMSFGGDWDPRYVGMRMLADALDRLTSATKEAKEERAAARNPIDHYINNLPPIPTKPKKLNANDKRGSV